MTVRRFEIFSTVAKHLNVTYASRELHVSQPAVSQELRRLQEAFGIRLIKKSRTGIELTETGSAFRKDVDTILAQLSALKSKYNSIAAVKGEERIALGASHGISTSLMPTLMKEFKKKHPEANLSLYTNNSGEIVKLLLRSKIDIAIASNPRKVPALTMEPFLSSSLCALVDAKHPLAKRKTIDVAELAKMPLVLRAGKASTSRTEMMLKKLRQFCPKPNIAFRCGSPEAVKTAVRQGTGVGILVDDTVQDELSRKEFRTIRIVGIDLSARSYLLYATKKPLSKAAEAFLDALRTRRLNNRSS